MHVYICLVDFSSMVSLALVFIDLNVHIFALNFKVAPFYTTY